MKTAQAQNLAPMEEMRTQFDHKIAALKAEADSTSAAYAKRETELAAKRSELEEELTNWRAKRGLSLKIVW